MRVLYVDFGIDLHLWESVESYYSESYRNTRRLKMSCPNTHISCREPATTFCAKLTMSLRVKELIQIFSLVANLQQSNILSIITAVRAPTITHSRQITFFILI